MEHAFNSSSRVEWRCRYSYIRTVQRLAYRLLNTGTEIFLVYPVLHRDGFIHPEAPLHCRHVVRVIDILRPVETLLLPAHGLLLPAAGR